MNEDTKIIESLDEEIKVLKKKKDEIKSKIKSKRSITKSNILRRMSTKFFKQMDYIDKEREKLGFNILSLPEKTELIIRHGIWKNIEEDLIYFNKEIEVNGGIKNEQQAA